MSGSETALAIAGLALITLLTRGFFVMPSRDIPLPAWLKQGLRYAPLAALVAILVPELVLTQGRLIQTWQDARLFAAAAATGWFYWRRGILGTIVAGMAVYLPLRLVMGW